MTTQSPNVSNQLVTSPMPLSERPFPLYQLAINGIEVRAWSGSVRDIDVRSQAAGQECTEVHDCPANAAGAPKRRIPQGQGRKSALATLVASSRVSTQQEAPVLPEPIFVLCHRRNIY